MKGDVDVYVYALLCGSGELEQQGAAPLLDGPFGVFEIGLAVDGTQVQNISAAEKEWVRKLVAVCEEVGGKCDVGVQSAGT